MKESITKIQEASGFKSSRVTTYGQQIEISKRRLEDYCRKECVIDLSGVEGKFDSHKFPFVSKMCGMWQPLNIRVATLPALVFSGLPFSIAGDAVSRLSLTVTLFSLTSC